MQKPSGFLLAIVAALPSIFAVLFTPALPALAQHFQITFGQAQQTMTFYLAGYALGQLPYGPLSNKYGRKPVFYLGMSLALLSSLLIILSGLTHSFSLFAFSRFFMACGACVGLNVVYTIIGDLYEEKAALKILSFVMLLSAIIPGIAMFTGGFLTELFNWYGCFGFLALFSLLMIVLVYYFFPKTHFQPDDKALQFTEIIQAYWKELRNKQLVYSALITGCGASMIYLFASTAPFVGIKLLNLSPEAYGTYALIPSIGLIIGSILTRTLTNTKSIETLMKIGAYGLLITAVVFACFFYFNFIRVYTLFFPMLIIDTLLAIVFTTTATIALTKAINKSIGSSLMSFINLSITTISVLILSLLPITGVIAFANLLILLALVAGTLIYRLRILLRN